MTTMLDLVRRPELGLTVVAASREQLQVPLTRGFITDLPEPARFLAPGMLVISSGLWTGDDNSSHAFIDALARAGAAALVVGLVEIGMIPNRVIARCRSHGLPLLATRDDIDFASIVDAIGGERQDSNALVERGLEFTGRLLHLSNDPTSLESMLTRFADEFGIECWLISGTGLDVIWSGRAPSAAERSRAWNRMVRSSLPEATIEHDDGRPAVVFALGGRPDLHAGFLVCRVDPRDMSAGVRVIVQSLLGVLRVEVMRAELGSAAMRHRQFQLIEVLMAGEAGAAELSARLRLEGADPALPIGALVASMSDEDYPPAGLLDLLMRTLTDLEPIGGIVDGSVVILLNGITEVSQALLDGLAAGVGGEQDLLDGRRVRIGVSDPVSDVVELGAAIAVARERMGGVTGREAVLIGYDARAHTHQALLATLGSRARDVYATALLGPVIDYDERHESDLIGTLIVFLDRMGAWQSAADELRIHPNTLRYRIGRISELTGRDLATMQDRVDLHLALACYDARAERAQAEPAQSAIDRAG